MWNRGLETAATGDCTLFQKLNWLYLRPDENGAQETFGALDLGGASTQITFVPQNKNIESPRNALHFRLYGRDYSVYTHSFLCYGKDQALRQKLAKDIRASITESRPTLPTSGPPAPTSCCSLSTSVIGLNLVTVLSKAFQAGYLTPCSQPLSIVPSRHHLLFVYCTVSKDTTQILSCK